MEKTAKKIFFTLDLEKDYGRIEDYEGFKNINRLIDLFKKYNLKLTVFATGKVIEKYPEIIKLFQNNINCEFHLHSYSHETARKLTQEERKKEIDNSARAYKNYFNKNPEGYRAPCGLITKEDISYLKKTGFKFSSSCIPTYRPFMFNNLKRDGKPFKYENGLREIPFSSIPYLKIPFSLSYFQFLGWSAVKSLLQIFKMPDNIVFSFHLHNLSRLDNIKQLKPVFKLFYLRNQNKGFKILEKFIKIAAAKNYNSAKINELILK